MRTKRIKPTDVAIEFIRKNQDQPGIIKKLVNEEIGNGVFSTREFEAEEFVLAYHGKVCLTDPGDGPYIFEVSNKIKRKTFWIDATVDDGYLGRFINDSVHAANLVVRKVVCDGNIHLCFFTNQKVSSGTEFRYNYGDGDFPWRQNMQKCHTTTKKPCQTQPDETNFNVRLLGSFDVSTVVASQHVILNTMQQVLNEPNIFRPAENATMQLNVSRSTLRLDGPLDSHTYRLEDIPCWAAHTTQKRLFGYIVREKTSDVFMCHILDCFANAEQICSSIHLKVLQVLEELQSASAGEKYQLLMGNSIYHNDKTARETVDAFRKLGNVAVAKTIIYPEVTHVVLHTVEQNIVQRTTSYLKGLAMNIPLVCWTWVKASVKEGRILPTKQFEVTGTTETVDTRGDRKMLFKGLSFFFQDFTSKAAIEEIAEYASANILTTDDKDELLALIPNEREANLTAVRVAVLGNGMRCVVNLCWFIDSICANKLQPVAAAVSLNLAKTNVSHPKNDRMVSAKESVVASSPNMKSGKESIVKNGQNLESFNSQGTETVEEIIVEEKQITVEDKQITVEDKQDFESLKETMGNTGSCEESMMEGEQKMEFENETTEEENQNVEYHEESIVEDSDSDSDTSNIIPIVPLSEPKLTIQKRSWSNQPTKRACSYKDKQHVCYFCEKLVYHVQRHMKLVHKKEKEMIQILGLNDENKKKKELKELMYKGDYNHNYSCLEKGKGVIIPRYCGRNNSNRSTDNMIPCIYCKALYLSTELWRHSSKCCLKPETSDSSNHVRDGRDLLPLQCSEELHKHILSKMTQDDVYNQVIGDELIKMYGTRLLEKKNPTKRHEMQHIASKLRELARLVIETSKKYNINDLSKCLEPANWENLIDSVKSVSEFDKDTGLYGIPSFASKLGYRLKDCAKIARNLAIKGGDTLLKDIYSNFIELYDSEYDSRVASVARKTLHLQTMNRPNLIPVTSDVILLHNYLKKKSTVLVETENCDESTYTELVKVTLAYLIVFNRKRSGEVERMTLTEYDNGIKNKSGSQLLDQEILNQLSKFEVHLLNSHVRIEILGKRGRKVPLLLTEHMQNLLNKVLTLRAQLEVESEYFFARPKSAQTPYRGCDVLRQFSDDCGAKQPRLLRATILRKQLATMSQVLTVNEYDQDRLASFMGHDIKIHRKFYQLPENVMETAKISKILHAINEGQLNEFQGKEYDAISVSSEDTLEIEEGEEGEGGEGDASTDEDDFDDDNDDDNIVPVKKRGSSTKKKKHQVVKWSDEEKKVVKKAFADDINKGKTPGKARVNVMQKKYPLLQLRDWAKVKYCVKNIIAKRNPKNMQKRYSI